MTLALKLWCIGATLALSVCGGGAAEELSCFQCNVTDEARCTTDFYRPCPTDRPYDKCQTRIRRNSEGQMSYEKSCVVAPCQLPDPANLALGLFCDQSKPAYDCVFCCTKSGCNGDGAGAAGLTMAVLLNFLPFLPLLWPYLPPLLRVV